MTSTLTDQLRALPDDALSALLRRRPDLLTPLPSDLAALAARMQSRVSVARIMESLDLFTLEVLDAARISRSPEDATTSYDAILSWIPAAEAPAARAALDRLRGLFLVFGPPDELGVMAGVDEVLPPHPAGLGRTAELLGDDAALGLARDPAGLRRALLAASPAGRAVLDRLAAGPPVGTVGPAAILDPEAPVGALVARGLLVPTADDTVELPREVAVALRRDNPLGPTHPRPPAFPDRCRPVSVIDNAGTGQVMETVRQTATLLGALSDEPAGILRSGGIGVRDLRRLSRAADVPEPVAALLIEIAAAAGLIGESDPGLRSAGADGRFLPTLAYDQWEATPTAAQWSRLARAWLAMNRQPGLLGRRVPASGPVPPAGRRPTAGDRDRPVSVLGPELERTGAPRLRFAVLSLLAGQPAGTTPELDDLLAALHWQAPRRSPWQPGGDVAAAEPVRWVLDEAAQVGLVALGGLTSFGRLLLDEALATAGRDPDDDPLGVADAVAGSPAVAALDALLPAPVDHFLIQADLTIVVPGPPEPTLATELATVAEHESTGGGSVYRVTPDGIRTALDSGYSASELHKLFAHRSRTPVPQTLTYLIDDTSRRHGGLRLGAAGCYLRSEDVALLAEIVADRRLAELSLRALAPTVLISPVSTPRVLPVLRAHGYAPVQENEGGAMVVGKPRTFRAPPRRSSISLASAAGDVLPGLTDARLAGAIETIRRGDTVARQARRAPEGVRSAGTGASAVQAHTQAMAVLQQAIRDKQRVWVGYVDAHGATASRLFRPISIGAGYLRAEDERTEMLHTLALHRITAAVPDA